MSFVFLCQNRKRFIHFCLSKKSLHFGIIARFFYQIIRHFRNERLLDKFFIYKIIIIQISLIHRP